MKKLLLAGSFLLATVSVSVAQQADRFGGWGGFSVGYMGFADHKLYDDLKDRTPSLAHLPLNAKFPTPKGGAVVFGGEGYDIYKSFLIGGELNVALGNKSEATYKNALAINEEDKEFTLATRRVGAAVMVNFGYLAFHKKNFIAYPLVGAGYGVSGHILSDPRSADLVNGRDYPFTNKISEQNALIYNHNFTYNLGIGTQFFVHKESDDECKGFSVGIRAGYQAQVAGNKYQANDQKLENSSSYAKSGNGGWFVRLIIGGGRIHRK